MRRVSPLALNRIAAAKSACVLFPCLMGGIRSTADGFIVLTSLNVATFSTDVLAPYRLPWRIEVGFKRLKSLNGLHGPPGLRRHDETRAPIGRG
jgi:hypothetical protein